MKSKNDNELVPIEVEKLHFDPQNPRFGLLNLESSSGEGNSLSDDDVITKMIKHHNVAELIASISTQGYFAGEPLLVVEKIKGKSYEVIEGNRRLAALKIINNQFGIKLPPTIIDILASDNLIKPATVPCLVFSERRDLLHYLGYRHITGVKSWGALEKAMYLKQLKDDLREQSNPSDVSEQEIHRKLAKEIGSTSPTVALSLTALELYLNARNNEFYELQGVKDKHVKFSFLYTALSYGSVNKYLGLHTPRDPSLEGLDESKARNLFLWMFKEKDSGKTTLEDSRRIAELAAVLDSSDATLNLEETQDLSTAYALSEGPTVAADKFLNIVDKNLTLYRGLVEQESYIYQSSQNIKLSAIQKKVQTILFTLSQLEHEKNKHIEG